MDRKTPSTITSVDRALTLLRTAIDEGSITVTAAAELLDVSPSTTSRLLATLEAKEFLSRGPKREFLPGPALGRSSPRSRDPRATLRPYLEQLFELTDETVHLATLVGTEVHHLDGIGAHHRTIVHAAMPDWTFPAHRTSQGRAMLAELSLEELQARYAADESIDAQALYEDLQPIRDQGYATNFERSEKGVAALSVSLGESEGVHLALSAALPITRYTPELGTSLSDALFTVRQNIRAASSK